VSSADVHAVDAVRAAVDGVLPLGGGAVADRVVVVVVAPDCGALAAGRGWAPQAASSATPAQAATAVMIGVRILDPPSVLPLPTQDVPGDHTSRRYRHPYVM
jgi:hypothetical protein